MATATLSSRPNSAEAKRRAAADELLGLFRKHEVALARIDELKADLKAIATEAGASFKEVFLGKGEVSVSGNKPKELLGEVPEVVPEAFLKLPAKERNGLVKLGIVRMAENWRGASYGRVTVKTF